MNTHQRIHACCRQQLRLIHRNGHPQPATAGASTAQHSATHTHIPSAGPALYTHRLQSANCGTTTASWAMLIGSHLQLCCECAVPARSTPALLSVVCHDLLHASAGVCPSDSQVLGKEARGRKDRRLDGHRRRQLQDTHTYAVLGLRTINTAAVLDAASVSRWSHTEGSKQGLLLLFEIA